MENKPRVFAYAGTALLLGAFIYLFTQQFIELTEMPGAAGTLVPIGFAVVFFSVSFAYIRRFVRKARQPAFVPWILAVLLIFPTLLLTVLTGRLESSGAFLIFYLLLIIGVFLGTHYGIQRGESLRAEFQHQQQRSPDVPEDLKKQHQDAPSN